MINASMFIPTNSLTLLVVLMCMRCMILIAHCCDIQYISFTEDSAKYQDKELSGIDLLSL